MVFDRIAERLFGLHRSCSEQPAKKMNPGNPSPSSTSAPSKRSTHRKGTPSLFAASSTGSPPAASAFTFVWPYGNEYSYLTSASPSLPSKKASSSATSKTRRAPLRSPSSAVIELRPARGPAAPRQKALGSMVELPAGMR